MDNSFRVGVRIRMKRMNILLNNKNLDKSLYRHSAR